MAAEGAPPDQIGRDVIAHLLSQEEGASQIGSDRIHPSVAHSPEFVGSLGAGSPRGCWLVLGKDAGYAGGPAALQLHPRVHRARSTATDPPTTTPNRTIAWKRTIQRYKSPVRFS